LLQFPYSQPYQQGQPYQQSQPFSYGQSDENDFEERQFSDTDETVVNKEKVTQNSEQTSFSPSNYPSLEDATPDIYPLPTTPLSRLNFSQERGAFPEGNNNDFSEMLPFPQLLSQKKDEKNGEQNADMPPNFSRLQRYQQPTTSTEILANGMGQFADVNNRQSSIALEMQKDLWRQETPEKTQQAGKQHQQQQNEEQPQRGIAKSI
jgi:hypothetical protein